MANEDNVLAPLSEWLIRTLKNPASLPRPPFRLVPEAHIEMAMTGAFYRQLNGNRSFQRGLDISFTSWTETRTRQFAQAWHLPRRGVTDLQFSHALWLATGQNKAVLLVGNRMYPASDSNTPESLKSLGYRQFPPQLLNTQNLALGAQRLYMRVTLRMPWLGIAQAEDPHGEDLSGLTKAVHDGVHRWARALGAQLPTIEPGRPRWHARRRPYATN